MRAIQPVLIHVSVIAGALALGLLARRLIPEGTRDPSASLRDTLPATPENTSPAARPEPALQDWSAAAWEEAAAGLRTAHRDTNPLRTQNGLLQKLLASARTPADFAVLADMLNDMPYCWEAQSAVEAIFRRWAVTDPAGAMEAMKKLDVPQVRQAAVQAVLTEWASQNPEAALTWLKTQPGGTARSQGPSIVMREMARRDPEGTARRCLEAETGSMEYGEAQTTLSVWAAKDPGKTLEAIAALPSDQRRHELLPSALLAITEKDPAFALQESLKVPAGDAPPISNDIVRQWATKDPASALREVTGLPEGEVRERLLFSLAQGGPADYSGLLETLPEGSDRAAFVNGLVDARLQSGLQPNPAEAAELAMKHATGTERVALLEKVGHMWPDIDAPAASLWLSRLEAGPDRDAAVGSFVRKLFETDPEASLVWSASLSDEGKRSRRLVELYTRWREKEPEVAQHWRDTSPDLPENARTELAEKFP